MHESVHFLYSPRATQQSCRITRRGDCLLDVGGRGSPLERVQHLIDCLVRDRSLRMRKQRQVLDPRPAKRDLDLPVAHSNHRARRKDTMRPSQQPSADNQVALTRRVTPPRDATCGGIRRE